MGQELTRRSFIGGALLAGAGLATAGALTACSSSGGNGGDDTGITWDREADVVIVGSGAAGLWGAIKAIDNGLTPLVLEKQPEATAGGDVRCSGGYLMPVSTDPDVVLSTGSFGEADEDLTYAIDEEGTAAIDWLIENDYFAWAGEEYTQVDGAGPAVYEGLLKAAQDAGAEILYETPGLSLITREGNEVIGVQAGSADAPMNVKAKYGVLIATGSYTKNAELMSNFHFPGFKYVTVGSPYVTGDGLIMAGNLGAKVSRLAKGWEVMHLASVAASDEIGTGIMCVAPSTNSCIVVNQDGKRFIDEYTSYTHNKGTLPLYDFEGSMTECRSNEARYLNSKMFEIVDANTFATCSLGNKSAGSSWANFFPEEDNGYIWSDDNSVELQKGWIIQGETIADLAAKIEVDPAALQATVDEYNAACASGADAFRSADKLAPLGAGPYYAIEVCTSIIYTIGGLTTDANGHTLNWSNQPIPRLYSAGNVGETVTYLQPTAINGAWGQAAIAMEDISSLDAWDAQTE